MRRLGPTPAAVAYRLATLVDAPEIAAVHVRGWQWGYRGLLPEALLASLSIPEREAMWRWALAPGRGVRVWLAERNGRLLGFASCGPPRGPDEPEGAGELHAIYLEEEAAGTGMGRALLARSASELVEAGYRSAILWVLDVNDRARRFYERAGWSHDGGVKREWMGETELRELRYAVPLRR